jgi:hypothetical protein
LNDELPLKWDVDARDEDDDVVNATFSGGRVVEEDIVALEEEEMTGIHCCWCW